LIYPPAHSQCVKFTFLWFLGHYTHENETESYIAVELQSVGLSI